MKIAVVVSTYPPYKGGMGNVAKDHAETLRKAGHEVDVLAPFLSLDPLVRIGNAAEVPQLMWKLRKYDAVELHYPFFGGAEWVWCWKKLFGKNSSLVILYHMDTVGKGVTGFVFKLYRWIFLKRILRSADKILVTSRDYFNSSQASEFKDDEKVIEIPLSVDPDRFGPAEKLVSSTCIFVGALDKAHYFKGVEDLIKAHTEVVKDLPEARLIIVGDGDMRKKYEVLVGQLGSEKEIEFKGRVSDEDLPEMYRSAGFVVLPSLDRSEAFGLVLLEAAASGLPAVVSDLAGVRSVIENGVTGTRFTPGDVMALAKEMKEMFLDTNRTDMMGKKARQRVLEKYSPEMMRDRLVDSFQG